MQDRQEGFLKKIVFNSYYDTTIHLLIRLFLEIFTKYENLFFGKIGKISS